MGVPTKEQRQKLDAKIERVKRHRQAISERKDSKGISRKEFHAILDHASQPTKRQSDSEKP